MCGHLFERTETKTNTTNNMHLSSLVVSWLNALIKLSEAAGVQAVVFYQRQA